MKKISQAIIGVTLILDVAVVFTFGLAVISSYEDGSRLPETTFARKAAVGRVAGEMTSTCPATANMMIEMPAEGATITTSAFGIRALANTGTAVPVSTTVYIVPSIISIPNIQASYIQTTSSWVADISIAAHQIQSGPFSFRAEGFDSIGRCIARSSLRTITINSNSSITLPASVVNITSPLDGTILSGNQVSVIGEITNLPSGAQIQEAKIAVLDNNNAHISGSPFNTPQDPASNNPFLRKLIIDSTQIDNGAYGIKMSVHYKGADGESKFIESPKINVNVNNPNTTDATPPSDATTSSGDNTTPTDSTTGTSGTSGSTSTDNTSTSGTGTSGTSSTTDNTSTGTSGSTGTTTTTPPPTGTTASTMTVTIIRPDPLTILRSRDNRLEAKTSVAASGLQFKIHKAGEPVIQYIPVNADYSDGINWRANMNLMIFNDGEYDITAVVGDIKSASLNVVVQKFAFNWLTPLPSQTPPVLSGNVPIKAKIGGIYEKDGTTPVKGVKAYFYQAKTTAPYTEIYNEQLYQIPGSQEWRLYDWTLKREKLWKTAASPNGKFHLIIKVINESISATEIWSPAEKILIEINNQQTVASSINTNASAVGTNNNQNLNTAATNTTATNAAASNSSNITVAGNTNAVNNTNSDSAQNANTANDSAAAAAQIDSDQDLLSDEDERARGTDPNLADTDNDGLTDFVEIDKYKTDPLKNDTDGDGYLDGEEVQSLHDPLKPPSDPTSAVLTKPKPVEEPKNVEKPILETLVVERIENKPLPLPDNTNNPEPPPDENTIVLKGKGPANTILTLFIYSVDPLVITVKTDDDGNWEYELDKKLEDGEHELYVTVTDDTGKIQSQSNPIAFFIKEAKAVSPENYRADLAAREPVKTSSTDIYLIASGVLVLIAAIAGLAVALRHKSVI